MITHIFYSLYTFFTSPKPKLVDTMCDMYNGAVWKELKNSNSISFVEQPCLLMLTLNIDWFQPFDKVTYSCVAIYLTINNLPCSDLFRAKNLILIELMPGPEKPKTNKINN
ncbi:hypothetical protein PHYBLDRAFT_153595 [Phycomyces blakesleeanus NRRL 1555(-)]|uniref:Uncharacterized protein n=1 Tax=Phycomyces blakesleeanus (strain ATCC 8743b / DSM 1359 / FGSC 10004 / NBRC 33097 / NRRL 1555) TaxID=763407 RepID=A0A162W8H2_PHYB8|nr:hypothetical protein PHYBLDRAFT_153595 [Phycomyces blakesleeanus NRRL 1555(-)]OAD65345.1 hypothetical protein PHYBLDRAFT_153595 [Phycomyces blakesleeanus NRRL 1555(-)]|eukprot:XP_018283385.1 hypothetical protein PHYBLDRAFT_153595 [Phycomyces blakesleeanus NRRL 1555(-)]